jgi:hypothetical protein
MFRLARVIVRLRSEPFGFSSIITYSFLFWRLLVGVKWWLALHWLKPKGSERSLTMTRASRNMLLNHYNQLFVVLTVISKSNTLINTQRNGHAQN